jgi:hypothetical protein
MSEEIQQLFDKIQILQNELEKCVSSQMNLVDCNRMMLECIGRIASGTSSDPRLDAGRTLSGVAMIAREAML